MEGPLEDGLGGLDGLDVFPIEWTGEDHGDDDAQYRVTVYGKTQAGDSVCAHIAFFPYFFVDLPRDWSDARRASFVADAVMKRGAVPQYSRVVRRASIWGFRPRMPDGSPVLEAVAQLAFPTREAAKKARYKYKYEKRQTYEAAVDPLIRLFHIRDIVPARWVTLRDCATVPPSERTSVADIEVSLVFTGVCPSPKTEPPPLVIASWDIECYSKSGNFPLPHLESDKCIQIATTFQRYGAPEPYLNAVVALEETDDVEGVEVVSVATEPELFGEWAGLLRREKADILVSYNGHQFDWKYVLGRQAVLVDDVSGEPLVDLGGLGRAVSGGGLPKEFSLNSAAYGQNSFTIAQTPGVLQIDLLQHMRREHKLESYSLDNVSKKFLGDAKLDLPPSEIFRKFLAGPADRADIARYAVKDTVLPLRLLQKLAVLENLFEMANAVTVPVDYLLNRGQQIKVFSLVLKKARQHSFLCPDDEGIGTTGKYEGATVLDAQRGAYFDIVSGLDFASLYPSILRAHTMCYSTIVLDARYADLPGVEYYTIQTGMGTYKFAQNVTSVVPELLEELAAFRKASKADMAAAKRAGDAFGVSVHNGKQLAYKISANSVYGFLGATKGFMPIVPIASAVTATGRAMIEHTKALAEALVPGSRVVYGDTDSVMVIFDTGDPATKHDMKTHFEIAERVAAEISKTFKRPIELEFEKCYYPVRWERFGNRAAASCLGRPNTSTPHAAVPAVLQEAVRGRDVHQPRQVRLRRRQGHPARAPRQLPAGPRGLAGGAGRHHGRQGPAAGRGRRARAPAPRPGRRAPHRKVRGLQSPARQLQEPQPAARPGRQKDPPAPGVPGQQRRARALRLRRGLHRQGAAAGPARRGPGLCRRARPQARPAVLRGAPAAEPHPNAAGAAGQGPAQGHPRARGHQGRDVHRERRQARADQRGAPPARDHLVLRHRLTRARLFSGSDVRVLTAGHRKQLKMALDLLMHKDPTQVIGAGVHLWGGVHRAGDQGAAETLGREFRRAIHQGRAKAALLHNQFRPGGPEFHAAAKRYAQSANAQGNARPAKRSK